MSVNDGTELGGASIRATWFGPGGEPAMRQQLLELLQWAILSQGGGQWGGRESWRD